MDGETYRSVPSAACSDDLRCSLAAGRRPSDEIAKAELKHARRQSSEAAHRNGEYAVLTLVIMGRAV